MPISRYPRTGHPIAPSVLSPLLKRKVRKLGVRLAELHAASWERFSEETCRQLGKAVVQCLAPQLEEIVNRYGSRRLGPVGPRLTRGDLDLEVRTYNCLGSINVDQRAGGIADLTIREVLRIRAFGIKSLVDLLTSIESVAGSDFIVDAPGRRTNIELLPAGTCEVIRRSGFVPTSIADLHVPPPPRGVKLADLGLRVRTFNALKKAGFRKDPTAIRTLTLRQAIQIPGFGTESLCDLIEAVERVECARYPLFSQRNVRRDETRVLLELLQAGSAPESVLEHSLPPLPPGIHIDDLGLQRRTLNVLVREGFNDHPERLSELTIRELCSFRGFGQRCIVDFFENICRVRESADYTKPATKSAFRSVSETLDAMFSYPEIAVVDQSDPRLGRFLRRISSKATTIGDLRGQREQLAILGRAEDVKRLHSEIARYVGLSIESELMDIVLSKQASPRNRQVVTEYYGFGGGPLVTLEVLGSRYNVTRERVRQICAPSRIAKLPAPPFAPALDTALNLIRDSLPDSSANLKKELVRQRLVQPGTTIESVKRAAHFLRREADFEYIGRGDSGFVLPTAQIGQLSTIEQTARKLVSKFGAAVIDDVLDHCDIALAEDKAEQLITVAVGSMKGFRWLDKSTGWFWFDSGHYSRLRPRIRKVLSICGQISVGELRTAIRRDYHLHGRVPPQRILLEICRQMPEVAIDGQEVVATTKDDPMELIRGDEAILVELLQDYGPVCRMEDLQKLAANAGVSRPSFWRCLQFCPTIARYGPCVYGLTGAVVQPGLVESLAGVRRPSQVITDHGWTGDGDVWIAYRVSQGAIESGVVGVPAAKRDFIQGQFALKTEHDSTDVGQLSVKHASAWGVGPFLRRSGVEEGDYLLLVFQLTSRVATVIVGDEGLLEQYRDAA